MVNSKDKKKTKQLTEFDKEVLMRSNSKILKRVEWLYEEVKKKRSRISDKLLEEVESEIISRGGNKDNKFYSLKDICKLLDWSFPENKEERNILSSLSGDLQINGCNAQAMLFNFVVRARTEDVDRASDLLLNKKQQKKARKRRKLEKKHGEKRKIKIPKDPHAKVAARKERAKIRKEAKKLGISTQEYREKHMKQ